MSHKENAIDYLMKKALTDKAKAELSLELLLEKLSELETTLLEISMRT